VDQEHADAMRRALANLNADLVRTHPDMSVGKHPLKAISASGHLSKFQDVERETPVI